MPSLSVTSALVYSQSLQASLEIQMKTHSQQLNNPVATFTVATRHIHVPHSTLSRLKMVIVVKKLPIFDLLDPEEKKTVVYLGYLLQLIFT